MTMKATEYSKEEMDEARSTANCASVHFDAVLTERDIETLAKIIAGVRAEAKKEIEASKE